MACHPLAVPVGARAAGQPYGRQLCCDFTLSREVLHIQRVSAAREEAKAYGDQSASTLPVATQDTAFG
ncbi:hypothetical protein WJX77_001872 [Trebouxia sp. C0004]